MKTWNDVKYLYYNIAGKMRYKFPRFEIDELVNETWIRTYPYFDDEHLINKIYQMMMVYIKKEMPRYRDKEIYRNVELSSLDCLKETNGSEDKNDIIPLVNEEGYTLIENVDYLEGKTIGISYDDKVLLHLKYVKGLSIMEMSKLYNLTYERIRQKLNEVYAKML